MLTCVHWSKELEMHMTKMNKLYLAGFSLDSAVSKSKLIHTLVKLREILKVKQKSFVDQSLILNFETAGIC